MRIFRPNVQRLLKKKNVQGLIKALHDPEWHIRLHAAKALGQIGGAGATESLVIALTDTNQHVREVAINALGEIGNARAVEALIVTLKKSDILIRHHAANALTKLGSPTIEPLINELESYDSSARNHAASVLAKIGSPAVESLVTTLNSDNEYVREIAARTLGEINEPRAIMPLIRAFEDDSEQVRQTAASSLEKLGWQPNNDKAGALYWIIKEQWKKCVEIGTSAVEPLITELTKTWRHKNQESITSALGKIGDVRAVEPLITILTREHSQTAVHEALIKIGSPAIQQLIATLKSDNMHTRKVVTILLGEISDIGATEALIAALKDEHEEVRQVASRALDKLGWQPGADEAAAYYWIAKKEWQECLKIGLPAVSPLVTIINVDKALSTQLACYTTIEQISGTQPHESDIQSLLESAINKIKRLYGRTRTITEETQIELGDTWQWEYSDAGEADYVQYTDYEYGEVYREEPDPDVEGIREFAASLPESLRERVRALCGEASSLF